MYSICINGILHLGDLGIYTYIIIYTYTYIHGQAIDLQGIQVIICRSDSNDIKRHLARGVLSLLAAGWTCLLRPPTAD